MSEDRWLSPKQIAAKYSVSYSTARRWIKLLVPHAPQAKYRPREKRSYHLRRIPESVLDAHLDELLNN